MCAFNAFFPISLCSVVLYAHICVVTMLVTYYSLCTQLTYTIKRRDLKSAYRDSSSQLIEKRCSEIESETRGLRTSIQVQWKPEEVEFHIAGLEEGVTGALHLIQEEFEVCDYLFALCITKNVLRHGDSINISLYIHRNKQVLPTNLSQLHWLILMNRRTPRQSVNSPLPCLQRKH